MLIQIQYMSININFLHRQKKNNYLFAKFIYLKGKKIKEIYNKIIRICLNPQYAKRRSSTYK